MSLNLDAIPTVEAEYERVIAAYARWEHRALVLQASDLRRAATSSRSPWACARAVRCATSVWRRLW